MIIGAGPTGLGAALTLTAEGHDGVVLLEQDDEAGGLAGSVRDGAGFTWDLGGHVQFSHYEAYDRLLDTALGDAWLHHERTATIRLLGRDVPYPFQHHLDALPERERAWATETLAAATKAPADDSFAAWLAATFGDGVCELFLRPYNQKVWQHSLEDMSATWLGERVARPRTAEDAGGSRASWGPNATFRYPARGGTGAIWTAAARMLPPGVLQTGRRVVSVDASARVLTLADGARVAYDVLVATSPLDALVQATHPLPDSVRAAAGDLVANSVELVGIGVGVPPSEQMRRRTWMYFPESASPYYRVTVLSNYAPANAPDARCYSLLAESSHPRDVTVDAQELVAATHSGLVRDGLIPEGAPLRSTWHRTLSRGYPVPTRGRDAALRVIHEALEPLRIFARGRFGGWKYEVSNQDHSFMQGVEIARRLLRGTPEMTYPHPDVANGRYHRD